jgi:hypothetical protein
LISCLQISDTNIHLAKESYESSQQRDLQVLPEADTCFTVHFTTSTLRYSKSIGKFSIAGYGDVPLECQERGAECDITICGRNTLDIDTSSTKMWRFSITGDIGPLVNHKDHPTSGKEFLAGFPTQMGNRASIFQRYQLVKTPANKANEWILTDPFMNLDEEILLVSRIVIRYILWTHINIENVIIFFTLTHTIRSFVFHQFRRNDTLSQMIDTLSQISTLPQTVKGGKIRTTG